MSLAPLRIVPAGAGSGKTYSIQELLGQWIVDGLVAPERIVAVTFTEAAAAELRERIRAKLLELGRLEDAIKLDQAYITTIHGFGLRLLTEFAFDSGLSPKPRLLNEDEENTLISLALARTEKADVITSNLNRFGYNFQFTPTKSAEEMFRADLLKVVKQLRAAGWSESNDISSLYASELIAEVYGLTTDGNKLTENLVSAVKKLLSKFSLSMADDFGTTKASKEDFTRDYKNLRLAVHESALKTNWKLWTELRKLRLKTTKAKIPDGYVEMATAVIEAADELPHHPGPREHANTHINTLVSAGKDVLVQYAKSKLEAGLVDYSDMIALAGEMLRNRKEVLDTLVSRIDCLVVDEFQDTNPLQFSFLWQLKEAGIPTLTVGDLKQAIMGFQGADPRLFSALIDNNKDLCKPLEQNWRSQPRIMDFVNAIGPGLFSNNYVSLEPMAKTRKLSALEVVAFPVKAKKGQHTVRANSLAGRLKELLTDDSQEIIDRRSKKTRALRGGDIAVLCPTHFMLAEYARILRAHGLKVRLQEDGWYTSRAVQLARQALAYVSNPADKHAALYLSVTELGSLDLQTALDQLMTQGKIHDPLLVKLDSLSLGVADRTVYALLADTLSTLNFYDLVSEWPNGEQARANLLRLQAESGEFMDANREALASGGFHGSGIQSFLAWLNSKVEQSANDKQPDPRVIDEDAVELVTWHSSKGREWPVVAVCGLDKPIKAKLPDMSLAYTSFEDLSKLLDYTQINYSPEFAAKETNEKFLSDLQQEAELESRRLLYVAITRPRDKLILEWPSYLADKGSQTAWSILNQQADVSLTENALVIGDSSFPCVVTVGGSDLSDVVIEENHEQDTASSIGRSAIRKERVNQDLTPDSVSPSTMANGVTGLVNTDTTSNIQVHKYHSGLDIELDMSPTALGTFIHYCFELLGANPNLVNRIEDITGIDLTENDLSNISESVESFEALIKSEFTPKSLAREQALLGLDDKGSVVSGIADLVVETEEGFWIIDHKSDQIEDSKASFMNYQIQLESYASILRGMDKKVLGVAINWIRKGEVVWLQY